MVEIIHCHNCQAEQTPGYKFCGSCGSKNLELFKQKVQANNKFDINLKRLAQYSVLIVIALVINAMIDTTLESVVAITIGFAVIDIVFAVSQPSVWKSVFKSVSLKPFLWIIPVFCLSGIVIGYLVDSLNSVLFEGQIFISYKDLFLDTDAPLIYSLIIIALFPALFEELAFRGFLFDNFKNIVGVNSAIWGSAFLFALVHFSLLSLFWLFPFGLILGYIRKKHATIIYGVVAHFVHNATVTIVEHYYGSLVF
ncbi:MAG: CPBP family glutamic-type intramembrane protease [Ekhidna sp.]